MKMRNEEGSVMVIALVMLALLTLFGVMATNLAQTEIQISNNHYRHTQAFYHAEAGLNWTIAALEIDSNRDDDNANWVWNFTRNDGLFNYSVTVRHAKDSTGKILRWGDSNNDLIGEVNTSDGKPIEIIRSTGYANGAITTVESMVYREFLPFDPKAAVYAGKNFLDNGTSNTVQGEWGQSSTCPAVWDIMTTGNAGMGYEASNYGGYPGAAPELHNGCTSYNVPKIIEVFKQYADFVAPGHYQNISPTSTPSMGDTDDPKITVIDGNFEVNNLTGYGVLAVNGNATISGNITWHGLIIVTGDVVYHGTGSKESEVIAIGDKSLYGALIGGGNVTFDGKNKVAFDCEAFNKIFNKYSHYKMKYWLHE